MSTMRLENSRCGNPAARRGVQRGFSIVAAIFLLVTLSALSVFMVSFSTTQQATATQDLQGIRAYQAARAGIEWGMYQVLTPVGAPATGSCTATPLAALGGTLSGFTVNVSCTSAVFSEGTTSITSYEITANASAGTAGTPQRVEREVRVMVSR